MPTPREVHINVDRSHDMVRNRQMANWTQLPPELLVSISDRLSLSGNDALDLTRFRSVCRLWRLSAPLPRRDSSPELPLRLPVWFSPRGNAPPPPGHFKLTHSTIYVVEPVVAVNNLVPCPPSDPKKWLLKLQHVAPGKVRVSPLLATFRICHPPVMFPKVLDLSNLRVSPISRGYDLNYMPEKGVTLSFCGDYYSLQAGKVAMSTECGDDFAVLAIHSGGKLAFMKAKDERWTDVDGDTTRYDDVICHDHKFYAVDCMGKTFTVESRFQFHPHELAQVPGGGGGAKKHLVASKSTGDLLLVDKYMDDVSGEDFTTKTVELKVFRLNSELQTWQEVDELGNESLFLGDDCAFSLTSEDLPGLKSNCIFFKDCRFSRYNYNPDSLRWFLSDDIGVFTLEDKCIRPLTAFSEICLLFWPPSIMALKLCFQDQQPWLSL